ncbi:MAG: hypothetical protein J6Z12_07000 [Paludibacteraceae bacterium]|nr:hypothetical protein [Paludibacteraceae bacterium]
MSGQESIWEKAFGKEEFADLRSTSFRDVLDGSILGKGYMSKLVWIVFITLAYMLTYMDNRIQCERQFKKIDQLQEQLEKERYIEMLTEADLLSEGREDRIIRLMKEQELDLHFVQDPPKHIKLKP